MTTYIHKSGTRMQTYKDARVNRDYNLIQEVKGLFYYCGMPVKKLIDKKGFYLRHDLFIEGKNPTNGKYFDIISTSKFKLGEIYLNESQQKQLNKIIL